MVFDGGEGRQEWDFIVCASKGLMLMRQASPMTLLHKQKTNASEIV